MTPALRDAILGALADLSAEDRAALFLLAEQRWCWTCGGPQGACACGWPKEDAKHHPDCYTAIDDGVCICHLLPPNLGEPAAAPLNPPEDQ